MIKQQKDLEKEWYAEVKKGTWEDLKKIYVEKVQGKEGDKEYLDDALKVACSVGNLEVIRGLIALRVSKGMDQEEALQWRSVLARGFEAACIFGELEVVEFLTSSEEMLRISGALVDANSANSLGFRMALQGEKWDVVKFLTTSEAIRRGGNSFADIHADGNFGFEQLCKKGNIEMVKWLSMSKEVRQAGHKKIKQYGIEMGFEEACEAGNKEIIELLTVSEEWRDGGYEWVDVRSNEGAGFRWACNENRQEVVRFLMSDERLKKTPLGVLDPLKDRELIRNGFKMGCKSGSLEVVKYIDSQIRGQWKIDLNEKEFEDVCRNAKRRGDWSTVQWLITQEMVGITEDLKSTCKHYPEAMALISAKQEYQELNDELLGLQEINREDSKSRGEDKKEKRL